MSKNAVDDLIGIVNTYNDSIDKWNADHPGVKPTLYRESNGKLTIDRVTKTLFENKKIYSDNVKGYSESDG